MIPITQQWCIQIEVTNRCPRRCSNCTRLIQHVRRPFAMDFDTFRKAVDSVADFPAHSDQSRTPRPKCVGLIGGEPTCHPRINEFARYLAHKVRPRRARGLWTLHDRATLRRRWPYLARTFGYVNINTHDRAHPSLHQPVLAAIREVVPDAGRMWELIGDCWLQRDWSASVTPKGVFHCEVAGVLDEIFAGPGGLPIEPGWWRRPLSDFREQIDRWCPRCGVALPLPGRWDYEGIDDITPGNLAELKRLGSPGVQRGAYRIFDADGYREELHRAGWDPVHYRRPQEVCL